MKYSEYGSTGLHVSAIGFGGMHFDISRSIQENADLLIHAREKGVNYFDTAPLYCDKQSETIFAHALKQMEKPFYVNSKINPLHAPTAQMAYDWIQRSLETLQVDHLDFYHMWAIRDLEIFQRAIHPEATYEGMLRAQQDGLIKNISVSTHLSGAGASSLLESECFSGILLGMNIMNFTYRFDALKTAKKLQKGVVVMNPHNFGLIPQFSDKLSFLGMDGYSPTQTALRFILGLPEVNIALVGISEHKHIDEACAMADDSPVWTDEDVRKTKKHVHAGMKNSCIACGKCDVCPVGIKVSAYMQHYNRKSLMGESREQIVKVLPRHLYFGLLADSDVRAEKCMGCGLCEQQCGQSIPITQRLREFIQWESEIPAEVTKKWLDLTRPLY